MDTYRMDLVKLRFNYRQTDNASTAYHEFDEVEVGREFNGKLVREISQHSAVGEGDKWYFDILFTDNTIQRVFNPNEAFFKPSRKEF